MTRFIIAGIRRTGTGLIRTTLNNHPQVHCIGEALNFGDRFHNKRGQNCEGGYRQYLDKTPAGHVQDLLMRRKMLEAYLDQFYASIEADAVGFKLMQTQMDRFPGVLDHLRERDVKVIHVVRENVLKTLVSRTAKRVTGKSHTTVKTKDTTVRLEPSSLLRHLERIERQNEVWPALCAGMPYIKTTYEDFVSNRSEELEKLLTFLNVEPMTDLSSHFVKGNSDNLTKIISNYDEAARILKGTRFEKFLFQ